MGAYEITLLDVQRIQGPNWFADQGEVSVRKADGQGGEIAHLYPQKRTYPVAKMPTTEAAIDYRFLRDIYVVLGDRQQDGGWTMRVYVKPLANWIWGGAFLMALGGALSLSDRRFRVAAGARKATPAKGVPAE